MITGKLKLLRVNKYPVLFFYDLVFVTRGPRHEFLRRRIDKKSYFDGWGLANASVASGNSHKNILLEKFGMSLNT